MNLNVKPSAALSSNLAIAAATAFGLCTVVLSFALDTRLAQPGHAVVVDAGLGLRGTISPQDEPSRSAPIATEPTRPSLIARL